MDGQWLIELQSTLGFLLVRLGLPLLITLVIAYWLARLDARWQAHAPVAHLAPAGPPCWERKDCAPAKRAHCPAYRQQGGVPCWQAHRYETGRLPERCFTCDIFLNA